MLYLFLIGYDPTLPADPSEPKSLQPEHAALERTLKAEGKFVAGGALIPPAMRPWIRLRKGALTEGPFQETKELVGGFFIIECEDEADVAKQAARIPVNSRSWIDAMPLWLLHADPDRIAAMPNVRIEGG